MLKAVVTDLSELFRLGIAKAEENKSFRRYLSAHHVSDTPFQILASEVQQHVDCTVCANCCRYSAVPVSRTEIEGIARHLGATLEGVIHHFTVPNPEARGERILRNSRNGCVFLDRNLCTIYDARPKTCRDFPHLSVGTHSLGSRPSSLARWAGLCPIVYNALERYKHRCGFHTPEHRPQPAA
jgi:Fe-S-cluster containining protein